MIFFRNVAQVRGVRDDGGFGRCQRVLERAEALRRTKSEVAQSGSMQSSACAFQGLLSIFLTAAPYLFPELELP